MLRFGLKTFMIVAGLITVALGLVVQFWPKDIMEMPPQVVLARLDTRFESLDSTMDFDEAFTALGLARYKLFLTTRACNSGGSSGMRTTYDLGIDGYMIEMVTYLDGRTACRLWTPNSKSCREAGLSDGEPMFSL